MQSEANHQLSLNERIAAALAAGCAHCAAQAYYEAHEVLEHVWMHCAGTDRDFLGGMILIAAALHKSRKQHHPRAARVIYARALRRLAAVPDRYRGIDVRDLELQAMLALRDPDRPTAFRIGERNSR